MRMPKEIGALHFVGIGGIGMSAIAEVCLALGYRVQGSDMSANANVERLKAKGVLTFVGHDANHVTGAGVLVVSSAIKPDNPELVAARAAGLPIVQRAEMLAELMRLKSSIAIAGTHGKTTTTSLVSTVLHAAGLDPTVINGGIIEAFGSNARVGAGEWLVAEADESDGSFVKLPAQVGVITNIDPEHMEHYGDFAGVKRAFCQFIEQIPFYGFVLAGIDHPVVMELVNEMRAARRLSSKRILTYGVADGADAQLINFQAVGGTVRFDLKLSNRMRGGGGTLAGFELPMPGLYNALNGAVAVSIAHEIGVEPAAIATGLSAFGGVRRRFTLVDTLGDVKFYDDYAHHPVEIEAVLGAARLSAKGKVIAIMQPHRFTRLKDHFMDFQHCFDQADMVIVAPVYAAGESPIDGFNHASLGAGITARGKDVHYIESEGDLVPLIRKLAGPGDLVIGLGAGSISGWMNNLPGALRQVAA